MYEQYAEIPVTPEQLELVDSCIPDGLKHLDKFISRQVLSVIDGGDDPEFVEMFTHTIVSKTQQEIDAYKFAARTASKDSLVYLVFGD